MRNGSLGKSWCGANRMLQRDTRGISTNTGALGAFRSWECHSAVWASGHPVLRHRFYRSVQCPMHCGRCNDVVTSEASKVKRACTRYNDIKGKRNATCTTDNCSLPRITPDWGLTLSDDGMHPCLDRVVLASERHLQEFETMRVTPLEWWKA